MKNLLLSKPQVVLAQLSALGIYSIKEVASFREICQTHPDHAAIIVKLAKSMGVW